MARLPRVSGAEMVRFLQRQGFQLIRIRSSHHFMERNEQRTSVPVHGNRELRIGTLRSILRDIAMTPTEFARLLRD